MEYVTKIQKERFFVCGTPECLNAEKMKNECHPLSRNEELSTVMDDPRSVYFKQMEHGMYENGYFRILSIYRL